MCIELVETSGEYEFQFDHDQGESDTTGAAGQCISGCCQQDIRQVQCSYCFFLFLFFSFFVGFLQNFTSCVL